MAKNKKQNKTHLWVMIIIAVLVMFFIFQLPRKSVPSVNSTTSIVSNQGTTYASNVLKITVKIPKSYAVEEKFGTISLKKTNQGEIIVTRTGTNYASLNEYLAAANRENRLINNIKSKPIEINGLSGVVSIADHQGNESLNHKGYSFYKKNWIYSIFTTSKDLYSDLDKIAQSFKYNE